MTSDGMLSCFTPFLLAIVKRRVADAAATARSSPPAAVAAAGGVLLSDEAAADGTPSGFLSTGVIAVEAGGGGAAAEEGRGRRPGDGDDAVPSSSSSSSCPRALCAEALWALSEYAVLSPGLAAAEVLPLAEGLASDTREDAQVSRCEPIVVPWLIGRSVGPKVVGVFVSCFSWISFFVSSSFALLARTGSSFEGKRNTGGDKRRAQTTFFRASVLTSSSQEVSTSVCLSEYTPSSFAVSVLAQRTRTPSVVTG